MKNTAETQRQPYETPRVEITYLLQEDVILTSIGAENGGQEESGWSGYY
ncbi:MAG: hypothetical protein LUE29_11600 [Lachnospiraceae bacterium]|nr:hypothetical protein [Lachnospiraceae bacterium]